MLSLPRLDGLARHLTPVALLAVVLAASSVLASRGHSQVAARTVNIDAVTPLIAKLKKQQEDLAANQTKIEAQTAELKEELRQARIYSARGGGGVRR